LILRIIIKFVATRCQILRLTCTKSFVGWGSAPDPAGGACSPPPDPNLDLRRPTSTGGRGEEAEEGKRGERVGKGDAHPGLGK